MLLKKGPESSLLVIASSYNLQLLIFWILYQISDIGARRHSMAVRFLRQKIEVNLKYFITKLFWGKDTYGQHTFKIKSKQVDVPE